MEYIKLWRERTHREGLHGGHYVKKPTTSQWS